jgi:hypothetical protein
MSNKTKKISRSGLSAGVVNLNNPQSRYDKLYGCAAKKYGYMSVSSEAVKIAEIYFKVMDVFKAFNLKQGIDHTKPFMMNDFIELNTPASDTPPILVADNFMACIDLLNVWGNQTGMNMIHGEVSQDHVIFRSLETNIERLILFSEWIKEKYVAGLKKIGFDTTIKTVANLHPPLTEEAKIIHSQYLYLIREYKD